MALVSTNKVALLLTSNGTTPTAANFLEVTDPIIISPEIAGGEYSRITGQLNAGNQRFNDLNNVQATFTASVFMRSNNVATDNLAALPEISNALKISGMDETVGADTVTYSNSQAPVGGTALVYVDGQKYSFEAGSVVANPTFTFTVGEPAKASFEMKGYLTSPIPVAEATPTVTLSTEPLVVVSKVDLVTVGGTTIKADTITIAANNTTENFYTLGGVNALKDIEILDNSWTVTATFFADSASFGADYTALQSQALQAIDIKVGTNASSALVDGKSINITCAKAEVQNVQDASDKGRVKRTVTYRLQNNSADANKAIEFLYGNFA